MEVMKTKITEGYLRVLLEPNFSHKLGCEGLSATHLIRSIQHE
jgi:hypothetical protein